MRIDFPCHIYIIEPDIKQIGQNAVKQKTATKSQREKRTVVKRAQTTKNWPQDQIKDHR